MFTGIIQEKGKIFQIANSIDGKKFSIESKNIFKELEIGDSVAVNGVCQTVVEINKNIFTVDTVNETLKKTTLKDLKIGASVNLETAVLPTTKMGGHFVQGHIDTVGNILQINKLQNSAEFLFSFSPQFRKYLATTGSIAIDGVSLTTAQIFDSSFKVALIPHTIETTIFTNYKIGDKVNLEFDIIGKYVESILLYSANSRVNEEFEPKSFLSSFIDQPQL